LAAVEATPGTENGVARKVAIYLCHRHSGARLREIGARFGIGESAVSQESRRLLGRIAADESLRQKIETVRQKLGIVNV